MPQVEAGVQGWAVVDGVSMPLEEATLPVTDVGFTHGLSVFETLMAAPGLDPAENLARLAASAAASLIPPPDEAQLRQEIELARSRIGSRALVRITLTGDGRRVVWATPPEDDRIGQPVRCVTGAHSDDAFVGGSVKHRSRLGWMVAVRRAGVDEVLLVDADGRFTEGTSSAILAVIDGRVWTAPWDGRILESTTNRRLIGLCGELGIEVVRTGAAAAGPFDGLYIASTTRSIAPVIELDGRGLPGWDPIGRLLAAADPVGPPPARPPPGEE